MCPRLLEVAAHARAQRLRLPHVEDRAFLFSEEVDPGPLGQRLQLGFHAVSHAAPSVASGYFYARHGSLAPRRGRRARTRRPCYCRRTKALVGAAEDIVRQPTITQAKAQLDLMSLAGLKAVRITATWSPGLRAPLPGEQNAIDIVADAASLTGMRVIVQVFHKDFTTTPLTDGGAWRVRRLHGGDRARQPDDQGLRDRQRAEPQSVLDAAIRPRRNEPVAGCVPRAAGSDL